MADTTPSFISVNDPGQRAVIAAIAAVIHTKGVKAFIAGGFIRDTLLKLPVCDLDVAVSGDTASLITDLADKLGSACFALDEGAGMFRITLPAGGAFSQVDIGDAWGTMEEDLARRDFTIDALACPLENFDIATGELPVIDPRGGMRDLEKRLIRAVSPDVFQKDPARLLRAVRLAAELRFTIEPATEVAITADAESVANVAGERTREELVRLLSLPSTGAVFEYLDRLSLLTRIFPELEPSRGVDQPKEHTWDVLGHQLKTVSSLDWVLRRGDWSYAMPEAKSIIPWDASTAAYFESPLNGGTTRLALTRLAALIHDIAKPETKVLAPNGRVRFYGHAGRGAVTAQEMLKRLRFSQKETKFVAAMVESHMRPNQMGPEAILPTPKAVYRYLRDTGEAAVATLYLSLADHLAARGPTLSLDNFREHVTIVNYVLAERGRQLEKSRTPRLLTGTDLQSRLGLRPGPEMGTILTAAGEAQATGEISTPEEAIEFARRLIERGANGS
ncbi:HD domain-containing protein [Dehalogenimonas sp. THU2]|uniref:CCA tRNA nucleotidyltransferase n=1 Tax=Dehalogenimonas sp. THU2 TaxID=3151121 RepID=UPI00321833B2